MSEGGLITAAQLALSPSAPPPFDGATPTTLPRSEVPVIGGSLPEVEKRLVLDALAQTRGNKTQAAKILGLPRIQLYTRLKRFGIR